LLMVRLNIRYGMAATTSLFKEMKSAIKRI
jgi:hypothetical protein